jgi:hypothetical protein
MGLAPKEQRPLKAKIKGSKTLIFTKKTLATKSVFRKDLFLTFHTKKPIHGR